MGDLPAEGENGERNYNPEVRYCPPLEGLCLKNVVLRLVRWWRRRGGGGGSAAATAAAEAEVAAAAGVVVVDN